MNPALCYAHLSASSLRSSGSGMFSNHEQGLTPPAYIISPHKGARKVRSMNYEMRIRLNLQFVGVGILRRRSSFAYFVNRNSGISKNSGAPSNW